MLNTNRDPPPQDEEGAAGCEASEPAQQAGAGGPQHLPRPQRPGAAGNPPADRDEAGQVSRSVWTHISLPSAPHPTPPSSSAPCMFVSSLNITVVYTLSVEHITKAFTVDAKLHKGFGILAWNIFWCAEMKWRVNAAKFTLLATLYEDRWSSAPVQHQVCELRLWFWALYRYSSTKPNLLLCEDGMDLVGLYPYQNFLTWHFKPFALH